MFCRGQMIGLASLCLGGGLLLGSLVPFGLPLCLAALALCAAGIYLFQR